MRCRGYRSRPSPLASITKPNAQIRLGASARGAQAASRERRQRGPAARCCALVFPRSDGRRAAAQSHAARAAAVWPALLVVFSCLVLLFTFYSSHKGCCVFFTGGRRVCVYTAGVKDAAAPLRPAVATTQGSLRVFLPLCGLELRVVVPVGLSSFLS